MIVHYLDILRTIGAVWPFKTDAPLIVDPNAVLPFTVAFQTLKTIAREPSQICQTHRRFQDPEAFFGLTAEVLKPCYRFTVGKELSSLITIASNHDLRY